MKKTPDLVQAFHSALTAPRGEARDGDFHKIACVVLTTDTPAARLAAKEIQNPFSAAYCWFLISLYTQNKQDVAVMLQRIRTILDDPRHLSDLELALEVRWACSNRDWVKARSVCDQVYDRDMHSHLLLAIANDSNLDVDLERFNAYTPTASTEGDNAHGSETFLSFSLSVSETWNWWAQETIEKLCTERTERIKTTKIQRILPFRELCLIAELDPSFAVAEMDRFEPAMDKDEVEALLCARAAGHAFRGEEALARELLAKVSQPGAEYRALAYARLHALKLKQALSQ